MRILLIARGSATTLVDDADFPLVCDYKWSLGGGGKRYAYAYIGGRTVAMHRLLAGAQPGQQVDHRDGDPLNNQRSNLRLCTASQNHGNKRKTTSATSSRFKGVSWVKEKRKWRAQATINGRLTYLGDFAEEADAAHAYDAAARAHFGEFALLNLPEVAR